MYKRSFVIALVSLLSFGAVKAQSTDANMGIIPAPVSVKQMPGEFILNQTTATVAIGTDSLLTDLKAYEFFKSYLKKEFGFDVTKATVISGSMSKILIKSVPQGPSGEGYQLSVRPTGITITGSGAGLFYGFQTLMQLIPLDHGTTVKLPCVEIEDYPRFGYRGLHLDVCRHFFGVEFVKKYIDLMASYKLNTFHWHLTDDQGWRIEIKKYPKLTEVGSVRAQTLLGSYRTKGSYDGIPHGGFYTQDEIREVIKYAADRYITIIPEIEMPGHAMAAIAAYPELSCEPKRTYKVAETWGVFDDVFCPSEKTFSFLQDVLTEVIDLFPSKYIHIGGDECPKEAWKKSAFCQQLIKKLKLKDEHGLQSYFIQRMEKFVNAKGRSIIGWDEILEGGLAPNATVMSWRGEEGGIAAAKQNHYVIMTPSSNGLYFDHLQGPRNLEPLSIGGFAPYPKVYNYNPVPSVLPVDQQKYILGVQANLWTEYIATEDKIEYMVLPRMMALSETAWSPLAKKDLKDFELRLPKHFAWLDKHGYNYRVSKAIGAVDTVTVGPKMSIDLKSPVIGAKIYYTLDGFKPSENTLLYEHPFTVDVPKGETRELQTIVITPTGHQSLISRSVTINRPLLPAITFDGNTPGAKYKMVSGSFTDAAQLDDAPVIDSGVTKTFNTSAFRKTKAYGVIFSGYIRIDNDGKYIFSSRAGDGAVLLIDNQPVLDNSSANADAHDGGEVLLQKGTHKFTLKYFDTNKRAAALHICMQAPGKPKGELSAETIYN